MKIQTLSLRKRRHDLQHAAGIVNRQRAIPLSLKGSPAIVHQPAPIIAPTVDEWFTNAVASYEARQAQAKAQAEVDARAAEIVAATRDAQATSEPYVEPVGAWGLTFSQVCTLVVAGVSAAVIAAIGMLYLYRLIHGQV